MTKRRARVLDAFYATGWLLEESKLSEIRDFLEAWSRGVAVDFQVDATAAADADEKQDQDPVMRDVQLVDGVAVVPIHGVISKRMNFLTRVSGGTSTDILKLQVLRLAAEGSVTAIVLDVDSPGGSVPGTAEAADAIYESRGSKPIVAVSNEEMSSAALWIGTAADEVVMATPTSQIGSLGVYRVRRDFTEAEKQEGIKTHIIKAGAEKAYGHPSTKMGDGERETHQADVDHLHSLFIAAVARNRGQTPEQVRERAGDAQVFFADAGITAGLADRIGTLDQVVAELRDQVSNPHPYFTFRKEHKMPKTNSGEAGAPAQSKSGSDQQVIVTEIPVGMTPEDMKASNPDAVKSLEDAAAAEVKAAEQERFAELQKAFADDPAYAMEAYSKGLTVEGAKAARHDNLVKQVGDLKAKVADLEKAADNAQVDFDATDAGDLADETTDEQQATAVAIWNANDDLRAEFGGAKGAFVADFKRNPDEYRKLRKK